MEKPKRVLFLECFPLWGCGSGTYTRELAFELNKDKDIKTAVVCPQGEKKIAGFRVYPLDMPFPVAFFGHPEWPVCKLYKDLSAKEITRVFNYFLRSVINAIEDFKPDLIHVQHISMLAWVASFIHAISGINYIITAHGTGILTAIKNKTFVPLSQNALRGAKKIIPVSGYTKKMLLETFGKEFAHKTRIIPGGIHIDSFPLKKPIKIINEKYNLGNKKVVLYVGKLFVEKGVEYIIRAAKDIKGHIYLIGEGPDRKQFEDLAYKLKLKNVHFLGYMGGDKREEFKEFYYKAQVFVMPSIIEEALGLVMLEAMACKTPVVGTRKGGIPLLVKDKVNGFLVRPKNSAKIAKACNKILSDKSLQEKMGNNARRIVEEKYTWAKTAQKYIRIYKDKYTNGKNGNSNGKNGKNGKH